MTAGTVVRNGTAPAEHVDIVDSYRDAARLLRRPFSRAAVKFKVQAAFPKTGPTSALIVGYIDARLAVERLNTVCPHLWFDEYQPVEGGRLLCRLTVDGITRHDIGEGYQGKGLYSDAFKRAAVKFGVGVSLYAIPKMILHKSDGHLKDVQTREGKTLGLTPQGEVRCRELYAAWLDNVGKQAFGEPLDHGDVEDSQGDAEAEVEVPAVAVAEQAEAAAAPPAETIAAKRAEELADAAFAVGVEEKLQLAASHALGRDVGDCSTKEAAAKALGALTAPAADKVDAWVSRKADEAVVNDG